MKLDVIGSRAFLSALRSLEPRHQVVVDMLASQPGITVPAKDLVTALYGTRRDGGPNNAENIVAKAVFDLRRLGFNIITMGWRGYALIRRTSLVRRREAA